MKRAMCVWLSGLPIELIRRRDRRAARLRGAPEDAEQRPILLWARLGQRQVVSACCERASAAGVVPGLPLGQARAVFPGEMGEHLRVLPADPQRDQAALGALAVWMQRFSPVCAPDGADGLVLDVSGCGPVFKGEERLLSLAIEALGRLGFQVRGAIAPSCACAWAVARFSPGAGAIVAGDGARAALRPLPVRALRIDEATERALGEVGVERIGQLLDLPRSVLPARFGGELLLRLDQALGEGIEIIEGVRVGAPVRSARLFDGPTTRMDAIELTVRELLDDLAAQLRAREQGARVVEAVLTRSDLEPLALRAVLGRPSRDPRHLWTLLRPKLERAHLGFGVEGVTLAALRTGRIAHAQTSRWVGGAGLGQQGAGGGTDAGAAGELSERLDTLANRLGRERVLGATLVESHIPERSVRLTAVDGEQMSVAIGRLPAASGPAASGPAGRRPSLLLDYPRPVEVMAMTPDGPVIWVGGVGAEFDEGGEAEGAERKTGKGREATEHRRAAAERAGRRVVMSIGPERVAPEWWRDGVDGRREGPTRDYFKVQDEQGRWLWIYREIAAGDESQESEETRCGPRWFLHGVWA